MDLQAELPGDALPLANVACVPVLARTSILSRCSVLDPDLALPGAIPVRLTGNTELTVGTLANGKGKCPPILIYRHLGAPDWDGWRHLMACKGENGRADHQRWLAPGKYPWLEAFTKPETPAESRATRVLQVGDGINGEAENTPS